MWSCKSFLRWLTSDSSSHTDSLTDLSADELERRYGAAVTGNHLLVETMAALALVASYGLALSALGGYLYHPRLHTPYAPLFLAVGCRAVPAGHLTPARWLARQHLV